MASHPFKSMFRNMGLLKKYVRINASASTFCSDSINVQISGQISAEELTIAEVQERLINCMGIDRGYKPLQSSRSHLLSLLPTSQADLPPRKMSDSFASVIIPLKDDVLLQEKYVASEGYVRLGRLLEDMDIFAVWIAQKHIQNPKQKPEDNTPYVIVTVLVDQISFTSYKAQHDANIRLSGHVSWVGSSSMEIVVWLEQFAHGHWEKMTRALFLMAARNSTNDSPALVNSLVPENEKEKEILMGGESRKKRRIQFQQQSLLKVVPNTEEQKVIHNTFLQTVDVRDPTIHKRVLPPNSMWMDEVSYSSIIFGQPEHRNLHNKIFGGFLMRNALELSLLAGNLYSKYHPELLHISDISFRKPVNVGSFINMHAHVVYTEQNFIQITVFADVIDPVSSQTVTTNSFQFTYKTPADVVRIIPRSYSDAMLYIDGRRNFQHVMGLG
ncbi:Acyl-coenzyme A thioesterase 9, mitochondrial [Cryptotermes secundus]|uniref:Acyl-coenzyme A thioesterase 9, mitochondrial n=1 Tax=Cryptotermes secundus TaxID=105785 RepID=A0A2J7Q221_9NEOP|nr:acyl-coenzyme A thioesterase 9, mitochondrial [Cryptotermes secundus]PNF22633.1 Acyl-coenzyme A thioesterase 9, mitochondrial [Cryptotermes secundus]